MKMKRKLVALGMSLVMTLGASTTALAWPSFQNDVSLNNGLIGDTYSYRTTGTPSVTVYGGLASAAWSGIDTAPLVNVENGVPYAYVLHSTGGGAIISKVNLTSPTSNVTGWSTDSSRNGVVVSSSTGFQLSTPIIVEDDLYTAANVYGNVVQNDEFSDYNDAVFDKWTVGTGAVTSGYTVAQVSQSEIVTGNYALKAAGSAIGNYEVSATQSGVFTIESSQLTNLRTAGGIKLTNVSSATVYVYVNGAVVGTYGYNSSVSGAEDLVLDNGLYCWNENVTAASASAASIQVVIDFTTSASNGSVELDYAELYEQTSGIGVIRDIDDDTTPECEAVISGIVGQINTPITTDGTYIYFGTYTTNGKYYKVNMATKNFTTFDMEGNSTYWAGAAVCGEYLVFGTEDGILYSLVKDSMKRRDLASLSTSSYIRSSICAIEPADEIGDVYKLYFTSRTGSTGYLWCYSLDEDGLLEYKWNTEIGYSNSTPVVSGDYIYVGHSKGVACVNTSGTKMWDTNGNAAFSTMTAVQASPIVKSVTENGVATDYIYVTTNLANGQGYCISSQQDADGMAPTLEWSTAVTQGTAGATYTLQGFAAGGGYLVFGNDYSNLIIIH